MNQQQTCRRNILKQSACALSVIAFVPLVSWSRLAQAGGVTRSDLHYQDQPKDGKKCANCAAFVPSPESPSSDGGCRILVGPVKPSGWCMAYTSK